MDRENGFTLLELAIVIVIIGITAMVAMPQLHSMVNETKLNSAVGEVVSAIQYAQNLAVKYRRVFYFKAKLNDNWVSVGDYRYKDDTSVHLDADPPVQKLGVVFHPLDKNQYVRDFDDMQEYEDVHITAIPADNYIYFYPDGHSSNTDITLSLALGNQQRTITVDGITGIITVD